MSTAENASQAIAACTAAQFVPDVILADYHLDRDNGLDAIAAVRAGLGRVAPAVIISADNSAEMQRMVRMQGHAFLRKPVKAAALRALMYQLTMARATAAE